MARKSRKKAVAIVRLTDEFNTLVFRDLRAKELKPLFVVLAAHSANIMGDYRNCAQEFKESYGREPHEGYYEMTREGFNRQAGSAKWLMIEAPEDRIDGLLKNMEVIANKKALEEVVHVTKRPKYKR